MKIKDIGLYAITDTGWLKEGEKLEDKVEKAILGGASMIQYREKNLKDHDLKSQALKIKEVCDKYGIPLIINDDINLASMIDADGVHLGQTDAKTEDARKLLGKEKIIGATAKTVKQAMDAYEAGADYLGSGALFGSTTKKDAILMSRELLRDIAQSVPIPVTAIGGIDETNAGCLRGLPISGLAVIKGIFGKKNVRQGAADILNCYNGRPVVQCITNHVTVNDVANMILAMGASPIMAHHIEEVTQVQERASALYLNLGATDDHEAMKEAYISAINCHHPVVIDPVGVGVSDLRRNRMAELLSLGKPSCIRGNYSEILALSRNHPTLNGLDDDGEDTGLEARIEIVKEYADRLDTVVVASGETDIISDGTNVCCLDTGHSMLRRITGSGCMLSAAIASELALIGDHTVLSHMSENTPVKARETAYIAGICKYFGDRANEAALNVLREGRGSMSFKTEFIDSI